MIATDERHYANITDFSSLPEVQELMTYTGEVVLHGMLHTLSYAKRI